MSALEGDSIRLWSLCNLSFEPAVESFSFGNFDCRSHLNWLRLRQSPPDVNTCSLASNSLGLTVILRSKVS